jgi:hypothetical protein
MDHYLNKWRMYEFLKHGVVTGIAIIAAGIGANLAESAVMPVEI